MEFKDYYKILGVEPDADDPAIKAAYRKLARKYHPDVSQETDAERRFKDVVEAYEVLKSAEKRAEYDELRQYGRQGRPFQPPPGWQPRGGGFAGAAQGRGPEFSDFFESMFGSTGRGRRPRPEGGNPALRGQDVEMDLPVMLEETLSDARKTLSYGLPSAGAAPPASKTLSVKIPAGVVDGERIRLKGQGAPGRGGAPNGDLYLSIRLVPHPLFEVQGHNLVIDVPLAPWEAALGAKVRVPTLTGQIDLSVAANSQGGQRVRLKGLGLSDKRGVRGDLYARYQVVMPPRDDATIRALWTQLAEQAAFDPRARWLER